MKKLLLLLIIPFWSFSQEWEQFFDNNHPVERGYSVKQTIDEGYILCGETGSFIYVIKTNELGEEEWNQTFGGSSNDSPGTSIQQTTDGGFIITGQLQGSTCLIKINGNGEEEWSQVYNGDIGNSVQQTIDGGYIITGTTDIYPLSEPNITGLLLLKTNEFGEEEWSQILGGMGSDVGNSVQQTTDGGFIVCGSTGTSVELTAEGAMQNTDIYLIKTDSNGEEEWSQTFGDIGYDSGNSVQQTTDGGFIITGILDKEGESWTGELTLIKTDENGNEQWQSLWNNGGGYSIEQTTDGGYIVGGTKWSSIEGNNIYLLKTDENGEEEWSEVYSGDLGFAVQQTIDGGYIMCGSIHNGYFEGFTNRDVYLVKIDSTGNITSTIEIPSIKKNLISKVDVLGRETTNNKGFQLHIYDDGSVEKKYLIK